MKKVAYKFYLPVLAVIFLNINIYASSDALTNRESQAKSSLTRLMEIAADGNLQDLKEELAKPNVNVNARDVYGQTALYWAAQNNKYEIIGELLQVKDIDAEIADAHGLTPLAIAITNYNTESVDVLLKYFTKSQKKAKCSIIEKRDEKLGYTPLMRAACSGNQAVVKLLLEAGADPSAYVKKDDKTVAALDLVAEKDNDITDLIETQTKEYTERSLKFKKALEEDKEDEANKLLAQGIGINAKNEDGFTLLHWLAFTNRKKYAQLLLDAKADVNAKSKLNFTPLHSACFYAGFKEIVAALINYKADIHAKDCKGNSPLHIAARHNYIEVVDLLVKNKATINATNNNKFTPLLCSIDKAFTAGNREVIKLLIDSKAEVNGESRDNLTLLLWAIDKSDRDMVELLINSKADVNAKVSFEQNTALHDAAKKGDKNIVEILIGAGADVNAKLSSGWTSWTPLHWAAREGHKNIVRLLIDSKAVCTKDIFGNTPLTLAADKGHKEIVEILEKAERLKIS